MAKLILRSGAVTTTKDITGKSCLKELMKIAPGGLDDPIIHVGSERIDHKKVDIERFLDNQFIQDVNIFSAPKGIVTAVVASVVASIAAGYVISKQLAKVNTQDQVQDSPNNSFFGQTNTIRLDELEPNIYGEQTSYPDLIVREGGYWEYIDNQKIIREHFLIGQGEYEFRSEARYEFTPFSAITGSSYETYGPGEVIPTIYGQFNSDVIDGQSLPGINNSDVTDGVTADGSGSVALDVRALPSDPTILDIRFITPDANWDQLYEDSLQGQVPIRCDFTYSYFADNGGSCDPNQVTRTGIMTLEYDSNSFQYFATIANIPAGESDCSDPTDGNYLNEISVTQKVGAVVTVVQPIVTDELQVSFDFRNGLRGTAEISVTATTPTQGGPTIENVYTYSDNTSSQRFFSEKIDISTINIFGTGLVVSIVRLNNDKNDNTDAAQVSQVATNSYRNNAVYNNVTTLGTERKATEQALKFTESKINIDVTRKTISYDLNSGQIISTLSSSRSFADAILHEYTQIQGLSANDLPLDDMYEIANRIGDLGNFDYTFADKQQVIKARLDLIANVARCLMTFTGEGYEIYRNEAQSFSAQFTPRNISADSPEEYSYRGVSESSNNGVQLKWTNPDDNKPTYVYYVVQGANSVECISNGDGTFTPSLPTIPLEIDLNGCRTLEQARNRADLECRSLIYVQKTLKITTLSDGENVSRGQVIKHADYYEDDVYSGEIASIDANDFTTYSTIKIPTGNYVVTYTDELGQIYGPVDCEITGDKTFTASMPEAYVSDGINSQLGSRVIISSLTLNDNNLYFVVDKTSNADGTVDLELSEYNEGVFPEND